MNFWFKVNLSSQGVIEDMECGEALFLAQVEVDIWIWNIDLELSLTWFTILTLIPMSPSTG